MRKVGDEPFKGAPQNRHPQVREVWGNAGTDGGRSGCGRSGGGVSCTSLLGRIPSSVDKNYLLQGNLLSKEKKQQPGSLG